MVISSGEAVAKRALAMPRPLADPGRQESGLSVERWGKACRLKRAMKAEAKAELNPKDPASVSVFVSSPQDAPCDTSARRR